MASVMNPPVKVNLGCGPSGLNDWLNFDYGALPLLSKFPMARRWLVKWGVLPDCYDVHWPPIRLVDIRKRFPLASESVQFIYCSQVLEHMERWESLHVLCECRRVLACGGCVRISVPDLAMICSSYLAGKGERPAQEACRILWGHPKDIAPQGHAGRFVRRFIRPHEWCYDHIEMELLLREAGFSNILRREFQQGATPDLERLELADHRPTSLYVEAFKSR